MKLLTDLAIVLRVVPYEERHRIVTALSQNSGKISALAMNAVQSKRFGSALEMFSAGDWHLVEGAGQNLFRLDEAKIRRSFENIRKNFETLTLASVFTELMIRLAPEGEPAPELFALHSNALAVLDERAKTWTQDFTLPLLNSFLIKLLRWNGHQPQLTNCSQCHHPLEDLELEMGATLLVEEAAWICSTCRPTTAHRGRVSMAGIQDLQNLHRIPIKHALSFALTTPADQKNIFNYLENLFAYHVPGFDKTQLKSLRFLGLESNPQSAAASPL